MRLIACHGLGFIVTSHFGAHSPPDPAGFRRLPLGAASVAVYTARDVTRQVAAHDSVMEVPDRIGYSFGHAAAGIQICDQVYLRGNVRTGGLQLVCCEANFFFSVTAMGVFTFIDLIFFVSIKF